MKGLFGRIYGRNKSEKFITIVSGLPRCGTSMMMQMLHAGGMPTVTDNIREADRDNPKGYYELELVKKIKEDSSWLEDCYGKAFKMVSLLLFNLPADKKYKVIFMKRNMKEMLASQRAMLKRLDKDTESEDSDSMQRNFKIHLSKVEKWIGSRENIDVIYMNYNDIVKNPQKNAKMLSRFFQNQLDEKKMAQIVERKLYRQRNRELRGGTH